MSNQVELMVEERTVSGKQVKQLHKQGIVPANMYSNHWLRATIGEQFGTTKAVG